MCETPGSGVFLGVGTLVGDVASGVASIAVPVIGGAVAVAAVVEFVIMNAVILAAAAAVFVAVMTVIVVAMRAAVKRAEHARVVNLAIGRPTHFPPAWSISAPPRALPAARFAIEAPRTIPATVVLNTERSADAAVAAR